MDIGSGRLHRGDTGAYHVVGPNHQADTGLLKYLCWGCIILGGHQHQRTAVGPLCSKLQDLIGLAVFAVDEDRIRTCFVVGLRPFQGLIQAPASYKSLDPGNDRKIIIGLGVLACLDFAAEDLDIFQRLRLALDKTIGLGK